jgi:hypothetical protein
LVSAAASRLTRRRGSPASPRQRAIDRRAAAARSPAPRAAASRDHRIGVASSAQSAAPPTGLGHSATAASRTASARRPAPRAQIGRAPARRRRAGQGASAPPPARSVDVAAISDAAGRVAAVATARPGSVATAARTRGSGSPASGRRSSSASPLTLRPMPSTAIARATGSSERSICSATSGACGTSPQHRDRRRRRHLIVVVAHRRPTSSASASSSRRSIARIAVDRSAADGEVTPCHTVVSAIVFSAGRSSVPPCALAPAR